MNAYNRSATESLSSHQWDKLYRLHMICGRI